MVRIAPLLARDRAILSGSTPLQGENSRYRKTLLMNNK